MANELEGPHFEIKLGEEGYPPLLARIPDPPRRLYGIGNPAALVPGIAMIGARKATPYGLSCVHAFALRAAERGCTIVSGGALGCDLEAHKTALEAQAPTVVVFGSGADVVYPKRGRKIFERVVASGGAVISENSWGSPPLRGMFPRRNRIIAGLSMLLVIAEAGLPSGTFSTADAALSAGRDVAVVPGSLASPTSKGSNRLLCQGATPIVDIPTFDAALEAAFASLPLSLMQSCNIAADEATRLKRAIEADELLATLAAGSYRIDDLVNLFSLSASELLKRLSTYELQGLVERAADGRYQVPVRVGQ